MVEYFTQLGDKRLTVTGHVSVTDKMFGEVHNATL